MNFLKPYIQRFYRLQWKLTFFYILITIAVLLLLETVFILGAYGFAHYQKNRILENQVSVVAERLGDYFHGSSINRNHMMQTLKDWPTEMGIQFKGFSAIFDPNGHLIAIEGNGSINRISALPVPVQKHIKTVLVPENRFKADFTPYTYKEKEVVFIVVPITEEKKIRGVFVVKAEQANVSPLSTSFPFTLGFFVIFFVGAAIVGITFGIVTSRNLVSRLQKILITSEKWSQGDFITLVDDSSRDEIGQLAGRLNQMAKQLQHLLRSKQDLATMEERTRLSRELHDSIKQQMFALSIWVNTAKSMIGENEHAARSHLDEAVNLISHIQQELNAIIHELRPVALENKNLVQVLEDYLYLWQEQNGISVHFEVQGEYQSLPNIEEAYFRIVQEALSNIARHSRANNVKVYLKYDQNVVISIHDNGCGFDVHQANRQGVGLSSMYERVRALGGNISIQSEKNKGTIITIECRPLEIMKDKV